ncbi:glycosyltransferase [Dermabacteraceae bacterium P7006]
MKKRIIFYIQEYKTLGGSVEATKTLSKALSNRGHSTEYIFGYPPANNDQNIYETYFCPNKGLRYTTLTNFSLLNPGPLKIKHLIRSMITPAWIAYRYLREYIFYRKLDANTVLIIPEPWGHAKRALSKAKAWGKNPLIISQLHTSFAAFNKGIPLSEDVEYIAKNTLFGCLSPSDADGFSTLFHSPVFSMKNPLLPPAKEPDQYDASRRKILYVGRLTSLKRVDLIIRSFALARESISDDWFLEICGDGEEGNRLKLLTKELGISDRIFFRGRVSNKDSIYDGAALTVLASEYEGQPLALLESSLYGVPVLATPASEDTVDIAKNCGFICEEESDSALAESMIKIINDPQVRIRKSEDCLKYSKQHDADLIAQKWENIFSLHKQ